jgi:alpha-D-ribose 1-methylphosphonate 5-triphosphate synthase subunit PhnG
MNDTVSIPAPGPNDARRHWMSVLARAPAEAIEAALERGGAMPAWTRVRGPETGLVMVRGRAGGSGSPFNLGEMTVTRCTVRLNSDAAGADRIGHAYVAGRDERQAELAAVADALLQDPAKSQDLQDTFIGPLAEAQREQRLTRAEKAAATRVEFFSLRTMRS